MDADDPQSANPPRVSLKVVMAQLFFGMFAIATSGWLTAEPTLTLHRQADGRLTCDYSFNAFGRVPAVTRHLDDLVDYDVTESQTQLPARPHESHGRVHSSSNLVLQGRDGSSFAIGNAFSLAEIDQMLESRADSSPRELKIAAGKGRLVGGWTLAGFGSFLLLGAIWNSLVLLLR
ncbi:MAG: hypothetical protein MPN21_09440 [Thermoanaerobaculia bacterium]|nr:hypothetical protein [Thermoanaerobaculia bacterium]